MDPTAFDFHESLKLAIEACETCKVNDDVEYREDGTVLITITVCPEHRILIPESLLPKPTNENLPADAATNGS